MALESIGIVTLCLIFTITVVCTLPHRHPAPLYGGINETMIEISSPGNQHDLNLNASMYRDQQAYITLLIELLPNSSRNLFVNFTFPHFTSTYVRCVPVVNETENCFNHTDYFPYFSSVIGLDHIMYAFRGIDELDFNDTVLLNSTFNATLESNITVTVNASVDKEALFFRFNNISVRDTDAGYINITFPVKPTTCVKVGEDYEFLVYVESDFFGDNVTDSNSVHVNGTEVFTAVMCGTQGFLQAGDQVFCRHDISHEYLSEEAAVDLMIFGRKIGQDSIHLEHANMSITGSSEIFDLSVNNFTNGILVPYLQLGDEIHIEILVVVRDNVKLGIDITWEVEVVYSSMGRQGAVYEESDYVSRSVSPAQYNPSETSINLGSQWHPGVPVHVEFDFTLPFGTVADISFVASFKSPSREIEQIQFPSSIIANPSTIIFENPSTTNINSNGFTAVLVQRNDKRKRRNVGISTEDDNMNIKHRVKRSTDWEYQVTRDVGSITNPSMIGTPNATVVVQITFLLPATTTLNAGDVIVMSSEVQYNGMSYQLGSINTTVGIPRLNITKTVQRVNATARPQTVRYNVTVEHTALSNSDAVDVTLTDNAFFHTIYFAKNLSPLLRTPGFSYDKNTGTFTWRKNILQVGDIMFLSYEAQAEGDGKTLPGGRSNYSASLLYHSIDTATALSGFSAVQYRQNTYVCVDKFEEEASSIILNHGLTALAFFLAILIGIILIAVIIIILYKTTNFPLFGQVKPKSCADFGEMGLRTKRLITDASAAMKKGMYNIKDYGSEIVEESIITILSMKDKLQCHRELDNMDIQDTIKVDTDIEDEQNTAMINTVLSLVASLRQNQDITPKTEKAATDTMNNNVKNLEKRLQVEFKIMLEEIYKTLSAKNKQRLLELQGKQSKEKTDLKQQAGDISEEEKKKLMKLLHEQHAKEQNELAYLLKLEQDEQSEIVRKEFTIRKRMALKQLQVDFLNDVKEKGNLNEEQAEWLMKEHAENQEKLQKIFDDEISRQRMILEEKLARRKQLAMAVESQEDDQSEILNTLAAQQMQSINKLKKQGILDEEQAQIYLDQIKAEMLQAKEKHDQERLRQANDLQKRLTERKKQRLAEKEKQHQQELDSIEKKHQQQQTDTAADPISLLESKMCALSQHRAEMSSLENEIDNEHATELQNNNDELTKKTKLEIQEVGKKLYQKLEEDGATNSQMNKILKQHDKDLEQLEAEQAENRQRQNENFKKQLAKRRREWAQRREDEKKEQIQLREHESKVVRKVIDNQVAMSEEERDKIMQEHEKQMVKLENSLTLNKLQQKRMLEEKLAEKRKRQMEKLEKKQVTEIRKQEKSHARNEDDDEEDQHAEKVSLLQKQAEQRIAILQGESLNYEEEMENIKDEMIKERANTLKEQEDRLGTMMAQLQLAKAQEMAKIEEQQKAITDLKANLMDDLNDRGVLSDPETKKVIEKHQEQQEKLNKKIDAQRNRQESVLKARLNERLAQRENTMIQMHEVQIKNAVQSAPNKFAAKIKRVALLHRQMMELEDFKNRSVTEVNQAIYEMRRQHELKKMQLLQEKELQFISGLVRLGHVKKDELLNVLKLLFPSRTNEELEDILQNICDEATEKENDENDMLNATSASMLETRIKSARLGRIAPPDADTPPKRRKKKKGGLKSRQYNAEEDPFESTARSLPPISYHRMSERSEPDGAYADDAYDSGDRMSQSMSNRKLPALRPKSSKKKRKPNSHALEPI